MWYELIPIEECPGLFLRELSSQAVSEFLAVTQKDGGERGTHYILWQGLRKSDGTHYFAGPEDIIPSGVLPNRAVIDLFEKLTEMSGLRKGTLDTAEKNFETTGSAGSSSS